MWAKLHRLVLDELAREPGLVTVRGRLGEHPGDERGT